MTQEIEVQIHLSEKQIEAYEYLSDKQTTEILYGGSAGGGKSFLGCFWIVSNCLQYPGTRYLIGRTELTSLKKSTLLTFFDVCKKLGMQAEKHFHYSSMSGVIKFSNGSEVYLADLKQNPSDPEFDSLGSTEYTGAFIDEASQVTNKAKNVLSSRLRYKHQEYKLVPKLLTGSNPTKNFLYAEFYKPWKKGELAKYRAYIPAKVTDNPYIDPNYVESLRRLDPVTRARLLDGNWEYDDDSTKLFQYDKILDMFTMNQTGTGRYYLSADIARYGGDKTVIYLWNDLCVEKIFVYSHYNTLQIQIELQRLMDKYKIPRSQVVIDEDGIGGGVVDNLPGVKGFVNNGKPFEEVMVKKQEGIKFDAIKKHNFANLKAQCYYKLADLVEQSKISIYNEIPIDVKEFLIEDLEQIKRKDPDKDGKLSIIPKEEIKENIGRSTDYSDALMMRMLFEIKTRPVLIM